MLAGEAQPPRLVTSTVSPGQARQEVGDDRRRRQDVLEVVEDEQDLPLAQEGVAAAPSAAAGGLPDAERLGDRRGSTRSGRRAAARGTKATPSAKSAAQVGRAAASASRVLPTPPGPVRVSRRTSGPRQKRPHGRQLALAPDQRRQRHGQRRQLQPRPGQRRQRRRLGVVGSVERRDRHRGPAPLRRRIWLDHGGAAAECQPAGWVSAEDGASESARVAATVRFGPHGAVTRRQPDLYRRLPQLAPLALARVTPRGGAITATALIGWRATDCRARRVATPPTSTRHGRRDARPIAVRRDPVLADRTSSGPAALAAQCGTGTCPGGRPTL